MPLNRDEVLKGNEVTRKVGIKAAIANILRNNPQMAYSINELVELTNATRNVVISTTRTLEKEYFVERVERNGDIYVWWSK